MQHFSVPPEGQVEMEEKEKVQSSRALLPLLYVGGGGHETNTSTHNTSQHWRSDMTRLSGTLMHSQPRAVLSLSCTYTDHIHVLSIFFFFFLIRALSSASHCPHSLCCSPLRLLRLFSPTLRPRPSLYLLSLAAGKALCMPTSVLCY